MLNQLVEQDSFEFNPYSADFVENPYRTYRILRDRFPVFKYKSFSNKLYLVSRYEDVRKILVSRDFLKENLAQCVPASGRFLQSSRQSMDLLRESLKPWLFFIDPPDHTRLRNSVSREFTTTAIQKVRPYIEERVQHVFAKLKEAGSIDIVQELARPLPAYVSAQLMGVQNDNIEDLVHHSEVLFGIFEQPLTISQYEAMSTSSLYFRKLLAKEIQKRRASGDASRLLGKLIFGAANELRDEELISFAGMLFSVGQETTENYITNSIYALMANRDQFELLCANPDLVGQATKELARYDTSVQFLSRIADRDIELHDEKIEKGSLVHIVLGSGNRDERRYKNPDALDITRSDIDNLPFGSGIHFCLGAALAKLQLEVVLENLIEYPSIKIKTDSVQRRKTVVIRGLKKLQLYL